MEGARRWRRRLAQWGLGGAVFCLALTPADAQQRIEVLHLPLPAPIETDTPPDKVLPVSLDTVLRLARDQNLQIALAREKLREACAQQELAQKHWLPEVTVGTANFRHEGGIQDFTGQLLRSSYGSMFGGMEMRGKMDVRDVAFQRIDAERKVWQQKGELSKLTSETLLDAAGTYVDLLAARTSEAVSLESEKLLRELAGLAETLARIDPGLRVEVVRITSEAQGQQLITRKMREGGNSAAAKLGYLLGLDPASTLVTVDCRMMALELVNCGESVDALVGQALTRGPGVRELEGLLALIEEARARASGMGRFIPNVEMSMLEGAFGAGPGSRMTWDNRWDAGLHLKWNLTEALTQRERRRLADSKIQQARLGHQDLRAKLTLGVREALEASRSNKDQMRLATLQIRDAEEAYALSRSRLKENIKGRSPSEVLMAIRTLAGARLGYLQALRDFDKAQLRLFVLVGAF
jgi:outer membrane protein TolC